MPTTTNLGLTYVTPLDPAYADIWGSTYNTMFVAFDCEFGTRTINQDYADFDLSKANLKDCSYEVYDNGNVSGSVTIDITNGNYHKMTLTGNVTSLTINNPSPTGDLCIVGLEIAQDGTGGYTFAFPSAIKWPNGGSAIAVTTTASAKDIFYIQTTNAGSTWAMAGYQQGYTSL
jgi:hypothetical protein